jgi:hypothetical protein
MHGDGGQHLHVEGTHGQHAPGRLAHQNKRLDQQFVQGHSLASTGRQFGGPFLQPGIAFGRVIPLVDLREDSLVARQIELHEPTASPIEELRDSGEQAKHSCP